MKVTWGEKRRGGTTTDARGPLKRRNATKKTTQTNISHWGKKREKKEPRSSDKVVVDNLFHIRGNRAGSRKLVSKIKEFLKTVRMNWGGHRSLKTEGKGRWNHTVSGGRLSEEENLVQRSGSDAGGQRMTVDLAHDAETRGEGKIEGPSRDVWREKGQFPAPI